MRAGDVGNIVDEVERVVGAALGELRAVSDRVVAGDAKRGKAVQARPRANPGIPSCPTKSVVRSSANRDCRSRL